MLMRYGTRTATVGKHAAIPWKSKRNSIERRNSIIVLETSTIIHLQARLTAVIRFTASWKGIQSVTEARGWRQ
jgi:hypothetical protein